MTFSTQLDRFEKQLQELNDANILVGFQSELGTNFNSETISNDPEMLKIAFVHEYGYDIHVTPKMITFLHRHGMQFKEETGKIHIPDRSYLRRECEEIEAGLNDKLYQDISKMFDGKLSANDVMENVGRRAVEAVCLLLGNDSYPQTLNDTDDTAQQITYHIIASLTK